MIQSTSSLPQDLLDSLLSDHHDFKVNVYQTDNQYTVEAELPGYQKENVSINYDDKTLTISVKNLETPYDDVAYLIKERSKDEQSRHFIFKNIDTSAIKASMSNGILTVTLPIKQTKTQISID
ncbi:Hsp20/alpha crystallin family protein [Staphylococcus edaphicus]|uniref:Heat-shock protein n=1 Tax=Staphylococcus edaphicus TaxID=1955013 RepID=A0A2C6WP88_9STAP|nr:Hsp20 family protein [Staphylococcus edaphicus]PHK49614.1 heat-shock protein [Staphylococcus edaphicus]UQW82046.1 Hsp20 family protein [Staphylococcus edaphicus]